jgi:hypothetical protein
MLEYLIDIFYQLFSFIIDDPTDGQNEFTSIFEETEYLKERRGETPEFNDFRLPDIMNAALNASIATMRPSDKILKM